MARKKKVATEAPTKTVKEQGPKTASSSKTDLEKHPKFDKFNTKGAK